MVMLLARCERTVYRATGRWPLNVRVERPEGIHEQNSHILPHIAINTVHRAPSPPAFSTPDNVIRRAGYPDCIVSTPAWMGDGYCGEKKGVNYRVLISRHNFRQNSHLETPCILRWMRSVDECRVFDPSFKCAGRKGVFDLYYYCTIQDAFAKSIGFFVGLCFVILSMGRKVYRVVGIDGMLSEKVRCQKRSSLLASS